MKGEPTCGGFVFLASVMIALSTSMNELAVKRGGEPLMQGSGEVDAGTDDLVATFWPAVLTGGTNVCGSLSSPLPAY